jgi:hypothetical protein
MLYERVSIIINAYVVDFECNETESKGNLVSLKKITWETLVEVLKVESRGENLVPKLRKKFELEFRYGSDGIPKIWQPGDDIDGAYKRAKDKIEALIPLFSRIKLLSDEKLKTVLPFDLDDGGEDDDKLVLISESNQSNVTSQFHKEIELLFVDAKRSVVSGTTAIPPYVLLLLLFLGWNELMAVLSSPFLFIMTLILGASLFMVYQLQYFGPLEEMAWAFSRQALAQIYQVLNQGIAAATTNTAAAAAAPRQSTTSSSSHE